MQLHPISIMKTGRGELISTAEKLRRLLGVAKDNEERTFIRKALFLIDNQIEISCGV